MRIGVAELVPLGGVGIGGVIGVRRVDRVLDVVLRDDEDEGSGVEGDWEEREDEEREDQSSVNWDSHL